MTVRPYTGESDTPPNQRKDGSRTLPPEFELYTRTLFGDELYQTFLQSLDEASPVSIRLNPFKIPADATVSNSLRPQLVPWCREGYWLDYRPNFTFDPLFHAGAYYVQEASSMFLAHVLRHWVKHPVVALDLCAAPGGKTTCARTALPEGSLLFANEPIGKRAQILSENIQKFGHPNVVVTQNYPHDYKKTRLAFDIIIADVPCSGEGMFRKDPQAIAEWSMQNVENCRQLQRSIITDIWDNLKPGGILVYSTCTFNAHEDEENVAWIVRQYNARLLPVPTKKEWGITGSLISNPLADSNHFPVYRFIPGRTCGEGLFMAALHKPGEDKNLSDDREIKQTQLLAEARKRLRILSHGVKEGTLKGRTIVPDHSWALSATADKPPYPTTALDYPTAIRYLRHEAITLGNDIPRGIVLLPSRGYALGFAKNLGNRANNLYPAGWSIKNSHVPEEQKIID